MIHFISVINWRFLLHTIIHLTTNIQKR